MTTTIIVSAICFAFGLLAGMSLQWRRNEARIDDLERTCQSFADALMSPDDDYWQDDDFDDDGQLAADEALVRAQVSE